LKKTGKVAYRDLSKTSRSSCFLVKIYAIIIS
jgi:hypothetical protein